MSDSSPSGDHPGADHPGADHPGADHPGADHPGDRPQRLNRRDVLRGRLWKLLKPAESGSKALRYPRTREDVDPTDSAPANEDQPKSPPKQIAGIIIEPVRTGTDFTQIESPTVPVFRPPGAVDERRFRAGCTRCGDCIEACPHDAIRKAPDRLAAIAGSPIIEADLSACRMCADYPCIAACEPGVLDFSLPKVMGTAKITEHLCVAHHGEVCTVCSEQCPVEQAIVWEDGKPIVQEDTCTGCGVCREVCPAPENAILLMPIFHRPTAKPQ